MHTTALVDEADVRSDRWMIVADRASELDFFGDLVAATLKSSGFTGSSVAPERAAADHGLQLDYDCG